MGKKKIDRLKKKHECEQVKKKKKNFDETSKPPPKNLMGTKEEKKRRRFILFFRRRKGVLVIGGKNDDQKQHEKNRIRNQNSCVQFPSSQKILTRTPLSLSLSHHERDDEEKTGEGEKETRVFRSGRRLLERGASIFRGGLDDDCDFDDDDGRAAMGVVR